MLMRFSMPFWPPAARTSAPRTMNVCPIIGESGQGLKRFETAGLRRWSHRPCCSEVLHHDMEVCRVIADSCTLCQRKVTAEWPASGPENQLIVMNDGRPIRLQFCSYTRFLASRCNDVFLRTVKQGRDVASPQFRSLIPRSLSNRSALTSELAVRRPESGSRSDGAALDSCYECLLLWSGLSQGAIP